MTTLTKYYLYVTNLRTIFEDEEGQGLAEYGLILALIAVVCIGAVTLLGTTIQDFLKQLADGFGGGGNGG